MLSIPLLPAQGLNHWVSLFSPVFPCLDFSAHRLPSLSRTSFDSYISLHIHSTHNDLWWPIYLSQWITNLMLKSSKSVLLTSIPPTSCEELTHWKRFWCWDWGQGDKGMTEDEMAGWHHWLDGRESEWTLGVGDEQGGLACCDSWGCRVVHDWATELNVLLEKKNLKKSAIVHISLSLSENLEAYQK